MDSPNGHRPALRSNRAVSALVSEVEQGGSIPLRLAAILMITLNQCTSGAKREKAGTVVVLGFFAPAAITSL